jgi:hypothetical protein
MDYRQLQRDLKAMRSQASEHARILHGKCRVLKPFKVWKRETKAALLASNDTVLALEVDGTTFTFTTLEQKQNMLASL